MDLKAFSQEVQVHLYMQKQKRGEQSACVSSAHPEDTYMALASSFFIFFFFPLTRINVLGMTQRKRLLLHLENFVMGLFSCSFKSPLKCKKFIHLISFLY